MSHLQHARKYEPGVHAFIVLSCARVWSGHGNALGVLHTRISEVFVSFVRMRVRVILVRVCVSRESVGLVSWAFCGIRTAGQRSCRSQIVRLHGLAGITRSRCDSGLVQTRAVDFGFHGVRMGICMQPHTCFFLMHTHRGLCACRTSVCARAARIRGHAYVHLSFLLSRLCVHACCDIVLLLCHHQLLDTACVQNHWIQGACLVCLDVCFRVHNRGRILISQ